MKTLARILAPLTLLEWGGILTYFYFSGRVAAFLHPMFRPLVLVTGLLLLVTAACVMFVGDHEHEHEHDHAHAHGGLTIGGGLAFLIMLVPMALAVGISPDSYSANLVQNRGVVKDIRSLPGAKKSAEAESIVAAPPSTLAQQSAEPHASTNRIAGQSADTPPLVEGEDAAADDSAPELPTNEEPAPVKAQAKPTPFVNPALKPNKSGNIKTELTDLVYASQSKATRKDFEGKRVEVLAQFLPLNHAGTATLTPMKRGSFKALRWVMTCCAADVTGCALTVEGAPKPAEVAEMGWMKIEGRVQFRPTPKGSSSSVSFGDFPEPVIVAEKITPASAPREKYLY